METYTIEDAVCIADTGDAIKVEAPEFEEPQWIPQSQVHEDSEVFAKSDRGNCIVTQFFAEKKGWV